MILYDASIFSSGWAPSWAWWLEKKYQKKKDPTCTCGAPMSWWGRITKPYRNHAVSPDAPTHRYKRSKHNEQAYVHFRKGAVKGTCAPDSRSWKEDNFPGMCTFSRICMYSGGAISIQGMVVTDPPNCSGT